MFLLTVFCIFRNDYYIFSNLWSSIDYREICMNLARHESVYYLIAGKMTLCHNYKGGINAGDVTY